MTPVSLQPANEPVQRLPLYEGEPTSIAELFLQTVELHNKPDMLNYKRDGQWLRIASAEFLQRARAIGLGLYHLGLRKGDRIAILAGNCPEWTLIDAGCQLAGLVDVPIYTTQAGQQVAYILNDSGARLLVVENRKLYERIRVDISACANVERVIFFDKAGVEVADALDLSEVEALGQKDHAEQPARAAELAAKITAQDMATIIYTSGTTGEPKGVVLTQGNIMSNVLDSAANYNFRPDDSVLSVLPLSHIFERNAMYQYMLHGMTIYYAESIDKLGENLREVNPTVLIAVPRLFEKIFERTEAKALKAGRLAVWLLNWAVAVGKRVARMQVAKQPVPFLLSLQHRLARRLVFSRWHSGLGGRIRLFISGGAALSEDIGYTFLGAGLPISQGYGLTETSPVMTSNPLDDNRIGTVGKPIRCVEVRLAADGEIETRGPNVMSGYYNKPEATSAAFTADGWFKTGDIGVLDQDGYLKITDRKKELFKTSGGKYIAPAPIEQLIKASRFVSQVVLIGNDRKFPAALVVPNWEALQDYAKLKHLEIKSRAEFCKHPRIIDLLERQVTGLTPNLAQYEKVKKVALLEHELTVDGGELTPTLKLKRRVVDEKYKAVIDELYLNAGS